MLVRMLVVGALLHMPALAEEIALPPPALAAASVAPPPAAVVPTNVVFRAFGPTGLEAAQVAAAFVVDGQEAPGVVEEACTRERCAYAIRPATALPPGAALTLALTPSPDEPLAYTAGEGPDTTPPTFPSDEIERVEVSFYSNLHSVGLVGDDAGFEIAVVGPAATDDTGVAAYRVVIEGLDALAFPPAPFASGDRPDQVVVAATLEDPTPGARCFSLVAIDHAGNEAPLGSSLCVDLRHDFEGPTGGCACAAPSLTGASGAASLVVAALLLRRRRSRAST